MPCSSDKLSWLVLAIDGCKIPLSAAAQGGNDRIVRHLLSIINVNPDSRDSDGRTPLYWAAAEGNEDAVLVLLQKSNAETEDHHGYTPLHIAAIRSHREVDLILTDEIASTRDDFFGLQSMFLENDKNF